MKRLQRRAVAAVGPGVRRAATPSTIDPSQFGSPKVPGRVGEAADDVAPPIVGEVLRSPGQGLDRSTRALMEARLGHDFSGVRVHADRRAAESARAVGALAYTVGRDIVFGAGEFRPRDAAGRGLLAHELTHVAQQRSATSGSGGPLRIASEDRFEREAAAVERSVAAGVPVGAESQVRAGIVGSQSPALRRRPAPGVMGDRRRGSTLPYREATELMECIRILGEESSAYCRQEVLGEKPPPPSHVDVAGISTPVPFAFDRPTRSGQSATGDIGSVSVEIKPDIRTRARDMRNRAETSIRFNSFNISYRARGGQVTSFSGPGAVRVTIQTTYGPGVTASSTSGYGRGTTDPDVAAGRTTLGFHEGQHGVDFTDFLTANPFPVFSGTVGMSTADFEQAMSDYRDARRDYQRDIARHSVEETDCVGTTMDEHNLENGEITTECTAAP